MIKHANLTHISIYFILFQTTKMWIMWSLPTVLVLLTCFVAALPQVTNNFDGVDDDVDILEKLLRQTNPSDEDILENIINPKDSYNDRSKALQSDLPQNFVAELNSLRMNITAALSTINQQGEILKGLIDGMLKQTKPAETTTLSTTTSKPDTDINMKSCDIDKVCVRKRQCASDDIDLNGKYKIQFRTADDGPCHYLETCCNIKDIVRKIKFYLL